MLFIFSLSGTCIIRGHCKQPGIIVLYLKIKPDFVKGMKMVIVGTGIDIIEVERIRKACINPRFPKKVFTDREWEHIESRGKNMQTVAGNFAAKEAVAKPWGPGLAKWDGRIFKYFVSLTGDRTWSFPGRHCSICQNWAGRGYGFRYLI